MADAIDDIVVELKQLLASADFEGATTTTKEKDWQDDAESYAASAVQIGGTGSRLTTKTAWLTSGEHAYLDAE